MRFGFLLLGFLLFMAWIWAFVVLHVVGAAIHLLLVVGFFFIVIHLFWTRRRAA
jgi:hypothetical protein